MAAGSQVVPTGSGGAQSGSCTESQGAGELCAEMFPSPFDFVLINIADPSRLTAFDLRWLYSCTVFKPIYERQLLKKCFGICHGVKPFLSVFAIVVLKRGLRVLTAGQLIADGHQPASPRAPP